MDITNLIGQKILTYEIKRPLGEGGMATVYYAENSIGKRVALKFLKPELFGSEKTKQRFRNEAQLLVRLEHPNIRQVIDWYEEGASMAIIMEYLEGKDLQSYVDEKGKVPEKQVIEWFSQILPAFSFTHEQQIVHRDIKPSNLFLTNRGSVKVLDFGIAQIHDMRLTGTDSSLGSPMFMSPEQIVTPKNVDSRTDIYSLGVTLFTLLAGEKPYDDSTGSSYKVQDAIVKEPLPKLNGVSEHINKVIQKATAKDPAKRYHSCEDFLNDLAPKIVVEQKRKDENTWVDEGAKKKVVEVEKKDPQPAKVVASSVKIEPPATQKAIDVVSQPTKSPLKSFFRGFMIFVTGGIVMVALLVWAAKKYGQEDTASLGDSTAIYRPPINTTATTTSQSDDDSDPSNSNNSQVITFETQKAVYEAKGYYVGKLINGRAIIGQNNKFGYVDENFSMVIPIQYTNLGNFSASGLANVKSDNGLWGAIDLNGNLVLRYVYEDLSEFNSSSEACATTNGQRYKINRNGDYLGTVGCE